VTRREHLRTLVAAIPAMMAIHERPPTMKIVADFELIENDAEGFEQHRPTGRVFYEVNGRRHTKAQFIAIGLTHPNPMARELIRGLQQSRTR
jgi:hypothetical protein